MPSLGEVILYMKGDDSQLESSLDGAKGKAGSFASTATNLLGGVVAGAAVAAAGAIVGIGTAAFNVSNDTATAAADIAASLGVPIEEAERFADVARRVYGNNFADSVGDAGAAVAELAKQLGITADDPSLQTMTENAFRLRDTFDIDVNESIGAVRTLMENFGVTGEEAFNLIAAGNQKGLNASGDLLDTINEYSVQFAAGGASASEMFSLIESGAQAGVLGTDKAADAFKEFRVRIADGSATTADALAQIGLSVDDITLGMSDGSLSAADAFNLVQEALNNTTDPVTRMQAGVGLLGTQFEDLGDAQALALTMTNDWAAGSEGAIASLDAKYATFGSAVDGIWRRLIVSISPYTDKLLELVNDAMPAVMGAFDTFDATVGPAMEATGNTINTVVNFVKGLFSGLKTSVDDNATGPLAYWKTWVDTNLPLVQQLFQNILNGIQQLWATFGPAIELIASTSFNNILLLIDTIMRNIGDLITLALQVLTGDWQGAGETLEGIVSRTWETIKTVIGNQLNLIKDLFGQIDWHAVGDAMMNGIRAGMEGAWRALKSWFEGELQRFRNLLPFSEPKDSSSPLVGLGKSGKALISNFKGGMEEEIGSLRNGFAGGLGNIADMMTPKTAAAGMGGGITLTVNVSGDNATYENGRIMARGVLDELRKRGR